MQPKFIHLRVHSPYSLLEGAIRFEALVEACKKYYMPAVAVADRNNVFGALEAAETLSKIGVQSITGVTLRLYEADAELGDVALYAQNETGYLNLMALCSRVYDNEHNQSGVQVSDLEALHEGVICLTGGPEGPINKILRNGNVAQARKLLQRLQTCFADRLYVELQRYAGFEPPIVEEGLIDLAYAMAIPLVATNQSFFMHGSDFRAHDALICIAEGAYVDQTDRRQYTEDHRLKSPEEMVTLFADLPEAVANTIEIAQRCAYRPTNRDPILPAFPCADEAAELTRQAQDGLAARLAAHPPAVAEDLYHERLAFELDTIVKMGFPGYFLIVADFIKWAKEQGIAVGPGRGSGAGSLVAWALTITDLDPLRFNLLFERFLNPERVSMPDFDIDFCQSRRDEVISYVQKKYGRQQVAQIITFGKLQARAVLRDVGRVLQMPYSQVDRLCKLVPNNPANPVTLPEAIDIEPRLKDAIAHEAGVEELVDISLRLEGLYRHASTHAAGLVIGDRPLTELVALYRDPKSDMPVTQFNMKWVEKAGLVKFDFLGLKTLTVIEKAIELLQLRAVDVDIDSIPLDDPKTFELLGQGDTVGVFQLESAGMRDTLKRMKPDTLEDIIALVALYRPGPMENIPRYISCKKGEEKPDYLHASLQPILEETYGVMIYQEQVMQIAQTLSGYSLGEADLLRRAMGKKIQAEMDAQKARFIEGAEARGVDTQNASSIFDQVNSFAGYGFNKSHAAAYALIAYQTAHLKANYPEAFLAASMSLDADNTDKLQVFKRDAEKRGITVLPPDVNASEVQFSIEDGCIRYALAAIRNVGSQAMQLLVEERKANGAFKDIFDFARRGSVFGLNRRMLQHLIAAGALDCLEPDRARASAGEKMIIGETSQAENERRTQQENLFGEADFAASLSLPMVDPWSQLQRLERERESIGFYLSGHPLDEYARAIKRVGVVRHVDIEKITAREVLLAGTILKIDERSGDNPFAFITLSDPDGHYEIALYSEALRASRDLLVVGTSVIATVRITRREEDIRLSGQVLRSIDDVVAGAGAGLRIYVDAPQALPSLATHLDGVSQANGRGGKISMILMGEQHEVEIHLPRAYMVTPKLTGALKAVRGVIQIEEI